MTGAVFEENPFWKMALTRTSVKMGDPILEAFAGSYQYSGKREGARVALNKKERDQEPEERQLES